MLDIFRWSLISFPKVLLFIFFSARSSQTPPIYPLLLAFFPWAWKWAYIFPVIKQNVLNPMTFISHFLRKLFKKWVYSLSSFHCCCSSFSLWSSSLKHNAIFPSVLRKVLPLVTCFWSDVYSSLAQWPLLSWRSSLIRPSRVSDALNPTLWVNPQASLKFCKVVGRSLYHELPLLSDSAVCQEVGFFGLPYVQHLFILGQSCSFFSSKE